MSDPIPDGPPPTDTTTAAPGAIPATPAGPALCGFVLPPARLPIPFRIPSLSQLFPFPPKLPGLPLGLKCDPNDPLGVVGSKPVYGGGRVGNYPPSPDDDFGQTGTS